MIFSKAIFFSVLSFALSCQSAAKAPSTTQFDFTIEGMICHMCTGTVTEAMKKVPGVHEASAEYPSLKAQVRGDDRVTQETIRAALAGVGFEARFPGEEVPAHSKPLPESVAAALDIKTISHGEEIETKAHLAPGKITIFDYYAEWCGPCHLLTPKLEHLVKESKNVALRKVDISKWDSAVAKQATLEFQLSGLPFVRVFDTDGKLLGEFEGNRFEKVEAMLQGKVEKK